MLWILGTHSPLSRALRWRSQEVEIAISEAQQVLASYFASFRLLQPQGLLDGLRARGFEVDEPSGRR